MRPYTHGVQLPRRYRARDKTRKTLKPNIPKPKAHAETRKPELHRKCEALDLETWNAGCDLCCWRKVGRQAPREQDMLRAQPDLNMRFSPSKIAP